VDAKSRYAYVAVMGEDRVAVIRLSDFTVRWINHVGRRPRHICPDASGRYLYLTLSRDGEVAKLDLVKEEVVARVATGQEARSMVVTPDGRYLYVVNYESQTLSKVATQDLRVVESVKTHPRPIGVTYDPVAHRVWVACYSGSIMVYEDRSRTAPQPPAMAAEPEAADQPKLTYVPGASLSKPSPQHYLKRDEEPAPSPAPPTEADPSGPESADRTAPALRYYIVVGSYADRTNAARRARELRLKGYEPYVMPDGKGHFRVCSHGYSTAAEAQRTLEVVQRNWLSSAWLLEQQP